MPVASLSPKMVIKVVNKYIGVENGYLAGFSYRTHKEFYPEYCDLDINPDDLPGTTRVRFITILSESEPKDQARILRGLLEFCPLDQSNAVETRTQELRDEIESEIKRLERASAVDSPRPTCTAEVVDRAIADAETLIKANGATSAVDRVHTALHGFLLDKCKREGITLPSEPNLSTAFKFLREQHRSFAVVGPRAQDITQILRACVSILDVMNPLRNRASMAHPNEHLLPSEEAMLVVNVARSILHFLDAKLTEPKP